jgi:Helicase conserved C-terminal domain
MRASRSPFKSCETTLNNRSRCLFKISSKRAQANHDVETIKNVIDRFTTARRQAALAPDEDPRLDELCRAAQQFEQALRPFVTRRLRGEDPLLTNFAAAIGHTAEPHPHRRVRQVNIEPGQSGGWVGPLFCAECLRESVRGLPAEVTRSSSFGRAGAWLANGYVSEDLDEGEIGNPDLDGSTRVGRKVQRARYWRNLLRPMHNIDPDGSTALPGLERLATHPRLTTAVREIESWTSRGEKVLVFGVFLQPLRILRDVLNIRNALRLARDGRPLPQSFHEQPRLLQLALQQTDLLLPAESGDEAQTLAQLKRKFTEGHRAYEKLRRQLVAEARRTVRSWRRDPILLAALAPDPRLDGALSDHLLAFTLERRLGQSSEVVPAHGKVLAEEFAVTHVQPLLSSDEVSSREADLAEAAAQILREAFVDDTDGRLSLYARVMEGATGGQTRRYLQATFNNPDVSPQVLIAQSAVGREGLNLHEACRVVVQFHAEWNPAVLEQQVGRVDRKGSKWERLAQEWIESDRSAEPPFIEIRQILFEGTYDAFQWQRVGTRQHGFNANLFGTLLPAEAWDRVPSNRVQDVRNAAPKFAP